MMRYAVWFQLELKHDYYGNTSPPVRMEPLKPTLDLLKTAEAVLRRNGGQLSVICEQDRLPLLSVAADGKVELLFALHATSPDFSFVTEGLDAERGHVALLDAMQVSPSVAQDMSAQPTTASVPRDAGMGMSPLAMVRLSIDPRTVGARFEVRLAAPRRPWTYHIMGASPEAGLDIRDHEGRVTFTALAARDGARGPIFGFRSDQDIALSDWPRQRFELRGEGPFGMRMILPVLPTPRPGPTADVYVNLN